MCVLLYENSLETYRMHLRKKSLIEFTTYFWNKIRIKNRNYEKNIKLDDFRKSGKKKNLRGHFWKLSDELFYWTWFVCRYCINSVYVLWKDSCFFLFLWEVSKKQV